MSRKIEGKKNKSHTLDGKRGLTELGLNKKEKGSCTEKSDKPPLSRVREGPKADPKTQKG